MRVKSITESLVTNTTEFTPVYEWRKTYGWRRIGFRTNIQRFTVEPAAEDDRSRIRYVPDALAGCTEIFRVAVQVTRDHCTYGPGGNILWFATEAEANANAAKRIKAGTARYRRLAKRMPGRFSENPR